MRPSWQLLPLYLASMFTHVGFGILFPVIPSYADDMGASVALGGLAVGIFSYIAALTLIPFGALSDKVGGRRVLIAGLLLFILVPLLYPLVSNVAQLILVRALHGIMCAAIIPTSSALIVSIAPTHKRGAALGWLSSYSLGGMTLGPILGGLLMSHYGFDAAFFACSAVPLVGLILLLVKQPVLQEKTSEDNPVTMSDWDWLRNRHAIAALLAPFFMTVGSGTIGAHMTLYVGGLGVSVGGAGGVITAMYAVSVMVRPPFGTLSDKVGRKPIIVVGFLICVLAMVFIATFSSFPAIIIAAMLYGAGMGMVMTSSFAMLADASPSTVIGRSMGAANSTLQVGMATGATVMGLIVGVSGYESMFEVAAIILGAGLVLVFALMRK